MTTHRLKCLPERFRPLWSGDKTCDKTCEIRRDDRGFRVGDHLMFAEWDEQHGYSGREITTEVTHILVGALPGRIVLPYDLVVMVFREVSRTETQPEAQS
jgi:hypothetical protein